MTKPTVLMTGPYTEWDMPVMEQDYRLLKLWEADDRDVIIAAHAADVLPRAPGQVADGRQG